MDKSVKPWHGWALVNRDWITPNIFYTRRDLIQFIGGEEEWAVYRKRGFHALRVVIQPEKPK